MSLILQVLLSLNILEKMTSLKNTLKCIKPKLLLFWAIVTGLSLSKILPLFWKISQGVHFAWYCPILVFKLNIYHVLMRELGHLGFSCFDPIATPDITYVLWYISINVNFVLIDCIFVLLLLVLKIQFNYLYYYVEIKNACCQYPVVKNAKSQSLFLASPGFMLPHWCSTSWNML